MSRNKIIGILITLTGLLFVAAVLVPTENGNLELKGNLYQLSVIFGMSAIFTRILIKEKANE